MHVHSPFVTGWMGVRYARRFGIPLIYTYHTQLEAYAHYVPFEPNATRYAASRLTRTFANLRRRSDRADPRHGAPLARARRHVRGSKRSQRHRRRALRRRAPPQRAARARWRRATDDRMLLCVGRLAREKNVELHCCVQGRGSPRRLARWRSPETGPPRRISTL